MAANGLFAKLKRGQSSLTSWIGAIAVFLVLGIPLLAAFVAMGVLGGGRLLFQIVNWFETGDWVEHSTKQDLDRFVGDQMAFNPVVESVLDFHPLVFYGAVALILWAVKSASD